MPARAERYFVGLMSGTSADGVDAVLAAIAGSGLKMKVRQVRHLYQPYEPALRRRVLAVSAGEKTTAVELARLSRDVGLAFADAAEALLKASRAPRAKVAGIGSHGQTVAHAPPEPHARPDQPVGATLQIGQPALLAARTGLTVVADFRQGDLAAGGQGAPLVAWPDYVLFHHQRLARVLVNIGGIANITFLPAQGLLADTLAFDTGPGNMVLDALAQRFFSKPYDRDGAIAAAGRSNPMLLNELLAEPYFRRPPPKTTGREMWGKVYVDRLVAIAQRRRVEPKDLVATATELTARSIVQAIATLTQRPHEVILCGGGAKNIHLAMRLRALLSPASTVSSERFDVDATAKEALSFAMLAAARLDGVPANVPAATGASRPSLLGSITEA